MTKEEKITFTNGQLLVPNTPTIPYIEGDGTGHDIWRASQMVFDAAVRKSYNATRRIVWKEVLAGEKSFNTLGTWLPDETVEAFRTYLVGIKGPLTTPVGKGIRSINVALRQLLDLYVCLRPVKYFTGVPSPVKRPELVDMIIFRENTEDIYAGVEFSESSDDVKRFLTILEHEFPSLFKKIRFPLTSGIGIKPVSKEGTERLVRAALRFALTQKRRNLTLVHKGNIMKFTEGAFREWGYAVAMSEFNGKVIDSGPFVAIPRPEGGEMLVKDVIADAFLQQILTRPEEYDVVATLNLNGDYISDALAAQVGGIGIAPGGNINYDTGHGVFEATHGTAPKYAGQDKVNPSSVILSGEMMFRHMGWHEAADALVHSMERTIAEKKVTYDFHRLMEGATLVSCSGFAEELIRRM